LESTGEKTDNNHKISEAPLSGLSSLAKHFQDEEIVLSWKEDSRSGERISCLLWPFFEEKINASKRGIAGVKGGAQPSFTRVSFLNGHPALRPAALKGGHQMSCDQPLFYVFPLPLPTNVSSLGGGGKTQRLVDI